MYTCNVFIPQLYWFKKMRTNLWVMFFISITTNIGMWFERFVIIATSLTRDYLPSSWGYFHPTWVDMCTFLGTFGLFFTLFLLFARFLPMIAISEVKGVAAVERHSFAPVRKRRSTSMARQLDIDQIKDKLGIGEDKVYAAMGAFETPEELVKAGRKIREMGYSKLDAMTPFPVHGIDEALGIPYSYPGLDRDLLLAHRLVHGAVPAVVHGRAPDDQAAAPLRPQPVSAGDRRQAAVRLLVLDSGGL